MMNGRFIVLFKSICLPISSHQPVVPGTVFLSKLPVCVTRSFPVQHMIFDNVLLSGTLDFHHHHYVHLEKSPESRD